MAWLSKVAAWNAEDNSSKSMEWEIFALVKRSLVFSKEAVFEAVSEEEAENSTAWVLCLCVGSSRRAWLAVFDTEVEICYVTT